MRGCRLVKNTDVSRETRKKAIDFRECGGAVVVELRECFVAPGAKPVGCKRLEMVVARGAGVVTKNAALRLGGDCVGLWRAVCAATSAARVRRECG